MSDGFLPDDIEPVHYQLHLYDLHLWNEVRPFKGRARIDLLVKTRTSKIILDAHQLSDIVANIPGYNVIRLKLDSRSQRVEIVLDSALDLGQAQLDITWGGWIGDEVGFYRTGDLFCTQFQPVDARRAFPCFDEPRFKATFDLTLEVEHGLTVLSNMPEERSTSQAGVDVVEFQRTPKMSCYLLAWGIGRMAYIETHIERNTSPLPIRVYAAPDDIQHAQFALETASRVLTMFSNMFGIDFPLPKADLLAVNEMTDEAMENWGLCIFRSNVLLLEGDPALNPSDANRVAYIIAHELAHQWFGNLVTPSTWDELWLNEGFATWAGWYAVDKLHPDWEIWPQFIVESMQEGFDLDSIESTHPVQVHVRSGLEVDSIFDDISYLKGAAVIRMLASYLGESKFITGVGKYLAKNAYGSTTGKDLWTALSLETGEDVGRIIRSWIHRPGFPVVSVVNISSETVDLEQDDILEEKGRWWIPILAVTTEGLEKGSFDTRKSSLTLKSPFIKLNHDSTGFYRTLLPERHLHSIQNRLQELSVGDRLGLLDDVAALTYEEEYPIATLMSLLEGYRHETNHTVWKCILGILHNLRVTFALEQAIMIGLRHFTSRLIAEPLKNTDWSPRHSDDYNQAMLRPMILREAGIMGDASVVREALQRFDRNGNETFDMMRTICDVAVSARGLPAVKELLDRYRSAKTTREKDIYVHAMGNLPSPVDAMKTIEIAFHGNIISTQDLFTLAGSISDNGPTTDVFWEFMRSDFDFIVKRMGDAMTTLERLLRETISSMSSFERAKEVKRFFKNRDTTGYQTGLDVAIDMIKGTAEFKRGAAKDLKQYLEQHGYIVHP